jgi:hypothetical protein
MGQSFESVVSLAITPHGFDGSVHRSNCFTYKHDGTSHSYFKPNRDSIDGNTPTFHDHHACDRD